MSILWIHEYRPKKRERKVMLSCKYVSRKGEIQLKYDFKKCSIETTFNSTIHVVNILTKIQREDLYGNIVRVCFTGGKLVFDTNILKTFPLKTT